MFVEQGEIFDFLVKFRGVLSEEGYSLAEEAVDPSPGRQGFGGGPR